MSHTRFTLTIQEHCTQNWDAMSKVEQGRFCGQCSTMVVDFTSMSDNQIREFFKSNKGSVCGRAHKTQLNREYTFHTYKAPWYANRILQFALTGLLTLKLSDTTGAQNQITSTELYPLEKGNEISPEQNSTQAEEKKLIAGKVWTGSAPVSGVVVRIEETGQSTTTDNDGNFKLELKDDFTGKQVTLSFIHPEFMYETLTVETSQIPVKNLEVYLHGHDIKMGIIMYDENRP